MKNIILIILSLCLFLSSCFSNREEKQINGKLECLPLKYATHLKIFKANGYFIVNIRNPWDTTKILHSYALVEKTSNVDLPADNNLTVIKTPVEKSLIFTSLHASLIKNLGCKDCISSLCDVEYVLDEDLKNDIATGKIKNLGSSMNPDVEKILVESPEIIMLSPYQTSGSFGLLGKTKIPLVECADYMENSPLAQAEWIKFYGLLFGRGNFADSVFLDIEKNYINLKEIAKGYSSRPKVLANSLTGAVWYMPAKKSTAAIFYMDAGFGYPFVNLEGFGTVPLNFESVFAKAADADCWIVKYNRTVDYNLESFAAENPNYKKFNAFKNKNVYACNLSYIPYYDQTPFRPDLLLKDLIKIAHPQAFEGYNLRYFKKLE